MGMIERKKRLMMMQTANKDSYIKNGLVLWLDGIEKGNVSGSWVDKVRGYEFVGYNNPVFGSDYVEFSASNSTYMKNADFLPIASEDGTIEVCAINANMDTAIIFMPKRVVPALAFGNYSNTGVIWSTNSNYIVKATSGFKTISISKNMVYVNGQQGEFYGSQNSWSNSDDTYNFIGARQAGNHYYYTGKIHSIRIYNRQLTEAEMLHNQQIDNQRFNLGLMV